MKIDKEFEKELRVVPASYIKKGYPSWPISDFPGMIEWTDEDMKACWVASATLHGSGNWDFNTWINLRKENKQL